jgi:hypothetical protein
MSSSNLTNEGEGIRAQQADVFGMLSAYGSHNLLH